MRNRIVIVIVLLIAASGCLLPRIVSSSSAVSSTQTRKSKVRRTLPRGQSSNNRTAARDYSKFTHRSDKHKSLACEKCHSAPTANWQVASGFPDVADFPAHEACSGCHRTQFFKGARPVICSVCHTKVSPRGKERFAFEKPNQPSQFGTLFPHGKHQDVIASILTERTRETAHAAAIRPRFMQETRATYNNCAICHTTNAGSPSPTGGFQDSFVPPAGTFKTMPAAHDSCFNCHWKNQEPTHRNCVGCHSLSQSDIPDRLAPVRVSLKFTHSREAHEAECTACHINITRENVVAGKPDVPITTCADSSCHGASLDNKKVTIETESDNRTRDAAFVCTKCHTSEKGRLAAPPGHRAALNK